MRGSLINKIFNDTFEPIDFKLEKKHYMLKNEGEPAKRR